MSSTSMERDSLERFDEAVMSDILIRLSAEELSNLHLVCRKWYKAIRNPYFMKTNLLLQQQYENMLVQAYDDEEDVYESTILSVQNGRLEHERAIGSLSEWIIHGSCNGLLLVQNCHQPNLLAITNPVTRSTIFLPQFESDMEKSSFAFVFVPSTETYHVIHVFETKASDNTPNVGCWKLTLKYEMSKTDIEGLRWIKLWETNMSSNPIRCGLNPLCLDNAVTIWRHDTDQAASKCFAWNITTDAANYCSLPPSFIQNNHAQKKEYFLLKKGEDFVCVDYDPSYTQVRINVFDWNAKRWIRRWVIGLSQYERFVGYEVHAITPYFIGQEDLLMVLGIDGHIIETNQFGARRELATLSGKTIMFCSSHVPSVISLKAALTFPKE